MRDWETFFQNLTEEEKFNLSVLRVVECTNGVIQYMYRCNDPLALSKDDTTRAMKFSMSSIKNMCIPLEDGDIVFDKELADVFSEIRTLYVNGAKKNIQEDYDEFLRISKIMVNVLGKEMIDRAHDYLVPRIVDIPPDKLKWGVHYMYGLFE